MLQFATLDQETLPPGWIAVADHPAFPSAGRRLANNMLAICETDRRLAAICKDAGHYVTAMSVAYLHAQDALTLSSLRQICAGSGLLTANRAAARIDFMAHLGLLDIDIGSHCRATPAFQQAWSAHLRAALDAATLIDPTLAPVCDALSDSDVYRAFLIAQAGRLHEMARGSDPFPALRSAFLHPVAGSAILHHLVLACTHEDFSPCDGAIVPLVALARRFGVSQPHVRRLLKRAEASRFLLHLGPSLRTFDPVGFPVIRFHYAMQLHELMECARSVLAMLEAPTRAASAPRYEQASALVL